jgi:hypothetical protein
MAVALGVRQHQRSQARFAHFDHRVACRVDVLALTPRRRVQQRQHGCIGTFAHDKHTSLVK